MPPLVVIIVGIILLIMLDVAYLSRVKDTVYAPLSRIMGEVDPIPAVISWILIFFGCYYLGAQPAQSLPEALSRGAMFGFSSYGIYNATNVATIPELHYRQPGALRMALLDTLWGTALCGATSAALWSVKVN